MRPGVAHLLELCVLGEFYARFSQDTQVNETLQVWNLFLQIFTLHKPDKQIRWTCDDFLVLHKNICCGYSFESNEYPQRMFLWRTRAGVYETLCPQHMLVPKDNLETRVLYYIRTAKAGKGR